MDKDYMQKVKDYLGGHDFFTHHQSRTAALKPYLDEMGRKSVLEVGGFPGALVEQCLRRSCSITTIESPQYFPQFYRQYLENNKVGSIIHNIVLGSPGITGIYWHYGIMCDILLHLNGVPFDFMRWLIQSCGTVFIIISTFGEARLRPALQHALNQGFSQISLQDMYKVLFLAGAGNIIKYGTEPDKQGRRTILRITK